MLVIGMVTTFTVKKNCQEGNSLLLENIEALAFNEGGEHGNIDTTLEPYYELSSKEIWIGNMPYPTRVPCCKHNNSSLSGCAKGLDRC